MYLEGKRGGHKVSAWCVVRRFTSSMGAFFCISANAVLTAIQPRTPHPA
jgi:hypothetical protein